MSTNAGTFLLAKESSPQPLHLISHKFLRFRRIFLTGVCILLVLSALIWVNRNANLWEKYQITQNYIAKVSRILEKKLLVNTTTTTTESGPKPPIVPPPSDARQPPTPRYYALSAIRPAADNIFFIETSCVFNRTKKSIDIRGGLSLSGRQLCSVYSAAVIHPERPVYLFHTCPLEPDFYNRSSDGGKRLLELPNVGLVQIGDNPEEWFRGTPIDGLAEKLKESPNPVEHSSDALRILLLWKYGGTYLDTDVIVLRNLTSLGVNWAGAETYRLIANGIINFDFKEGGHLMAEALLNQMKTKYRPQNWTSIGPQFISDVLFDICGIANKKEFPLEKRMACGFMIVPTPKVYPIHWNRYWDYFEEGSWQKYKYQFAEAYTAHVWNKLSFKKQPANDSVYVQLAEIYCPLIYRFSDIF